LGELGEPSVRKKKEAKESGKEIWGKGEALEMRNSFWQRGERKKKERTEEVYTKLTSHITHLEKKKSAKRKWNIRT